MRESYKMRRGFFYFIFDFVSLFFFFGMTQKEREEGASHTLSKPVKIYNMDQPHSKFPIGKYPIIAPKKLMPFDRR